ncbi:hypothetical protein P692DRAFT_20718960, partial [Suillus brevipes Sb2]
EHPRTLLNNLLQRMYGPTAGEHVRWEVHSMGPLHALIWHATLYIDDVVCSQCTASTRHQAQDMAAMQAIRLFHIEGPPMLTGLPILTRRTGQTGQTGQTGWTNILG